MKRFAVLSTVALFSLARRESSTIASRSSSFDRIYALSWWPRTRNWPPPLLSPTSDPPYFLWAAVHFALNMSRARNYRQEAVRNPRKPGKPPPLGGRKRSTKGAGSAIDEMSNFDQTGTGTECDTLPYNYGNPCTASSSCRGRRPDHPYLPDSATRVGRL